jgi:putative ABC transport system permease protein
MNIQDHIVQSWHNLISAKVRSLLAVLGILVGTGAVVALVTSTRLSTDYELSKFKTLGTNLVSINLVKSMPNDTSEVTKQFKLNDMKALYQTSPQITRIAPYSQAYTSVSYRDQVFSSSTVVGVTKDFFSILKIPLAEGRFVSVLDKSKPYCVVGSAIAKKIRQSGHDPLGAHVLVGKMIFTVVGVVKSWKPTMFYYADINSSVMVPVLAARYLSPPAPIGSILVRLKPRSNLSAVERSLKVTLQNMLPQSKVYLRDPQQIISVIGKAKQTNNILLTAIGAISLLVGAIGVMNIMLVSVMERRREIGIRLAIGAKRRDILNMFLIESVVLTLFGGTLGIVSGLAVSYVLSQAYHWGYSFYWLPPALGFSVSVLVGIVSGYYPAWRASRLDPVEILQV